MRLSTEFQGPRKRFNAFHGKASLVGEKRSKARYVPAISMVFVARTNVRRVGGVLDSKDMHNQDFCLVATKTIIYFKVLPIRHLRAMRRTGKAFGEDLMLRRRNYSVDSANLLSFRVPRPFRLRHGPRAA